MTPGAPLILAHIKTGKAAGLMIIITSPNLQKTHNNPGWSTANMFDTCKTFSMPLRGQEGSGEPEYEPISHRMNPFQRKMTSKNTSGLPNFKRNVAKCVGLEKLYKTMWTKNMRLSFRKRFERHWTNSQIQVRKGLACC